jgi:hypothetical protein
MTPEAMYAAFGSLRKEARAGVDGVTYGEYHKDAERNIQELYQRLKDGNQAQPLRRVYIPKEHGKQRPISIPALEDKIVQKAVEILNAIYEQDFLDGSLSTYAWPYFSMRSGEPVGHGCNSLRGAESAAQPPELSSEIGLTSEPGVGGHLGLQAECEVIKS